MSLEAQVDQIRAMVVRTENAATAAHAGIETLRNELRETRSTINTSITQTMVQARGDHLELQETFRGLKSTMADGMNALTAGLVDLRSALASLVGTLSGGDADNGTNGNGHGSSNGKAKAHHRKVPRGGKNKGRGQGTRQASSRLEKP
jgi:hypothetical protein